MLFLKSAALALLFAIVCFASPAGADWFPGCCTPDEGPDYGPDYWSAAVYDVSYYNGNACQYSCWPVGIEYNQGLPVEFVLGYDLSIGQSQGYAYSACLVTGQIPTLFGCAASVDYQGCQCRNTGQAWTKDPINIVSGGVFEAATDYTTVGQHPLTAQRYYNSNLIYATEPPTLYSPVYNFLYSRFGFGWRSEYDRYVIPNGSPSQATALDAIRADGEPVHFAKDPVYGWYVAYWTNGGWTSYSSPRTDINIRISEDGTYWYITDAADTIDQYNATGELLTVTYRDGYQQTLSYSSCGTDNSGNQVICNTQVADSQGREITFNYQQNTGLVTSIVASNSNTNTTTTTQYSYLDRSGASPPLQAGTWGLWVLQTATFADNTAVTYGYTDPNPVNRFALTGITDEDSNQYASFTYDGTTGRATSNQLAGGADYTSILYDDSANPPTRTVTNALGKQFIYSLNSYEGRYQVASIAGQASAHTVASTIGYQYDTNGFLNLLTSGESRQTYYQNDQLGRVLTEIDGNQSQWARTIATQWDPTYDVPDVITEPNLTISMSWPNGLLTQLTETDTTTQNVPYSTNGETAPMAKPGTGSSPTTRPAANARRLQGSFGRFRVRWVRARRRPIATTPAAS